MRIASQNNRTFVEIPTLDVMLDRTGEMSFILKPSKHGIGVFITHGVKEDTELVDLFSFDAGGLNADLKAGNIRFIRMEQVSDQPLLQAFCDFYGVEIDGGYAIAKRFNRMDIGWYLNHSDQPNARRDNTYHYYALRDIKGGEEIFIDYSTLA